MSCQQRRAKVPTILRKDLTFKRLEKAQTFLQNQLLSAFSLNPGQNQLPNASTLSEEFPSDVVVLSLDSFTLFASVSANKKKAKKRKHITVNGCWI